MVVDGGGGPFALLKLMSDVSVRHFPQTAAAAQHFFTHAQTTLVHLPYSSPHALLTSCTHVLSPSAISQAKLFQETYREAREKLESEMDASRQEVHLASSEGHGDIFEQLVRLVGSSSSSAEGGGGVTSPTPLRRQTSTTGNIFNEVIRAVHSSASLDHTLSSPPTMPLPSSTHHAAGERGEGRGTVSYVWQFSKYISKLVDLLVKCLNGKASSKRYLISNTTNLRIL